MTNSQLLLLQGADPNLGFCEQLPLQVSLYQFFFYLWIRILLSAISVKKVMDAVEYGKDFFNGVWFFFIPRLALANKFILN